MHRPMFALLSLFLSCRPAAAAPPRNVILCIGDGMSTQQVAAACLYAGRDLCFEGLPYRTLVTTFSANDTVTDSAAAATAMATGYKVKNGVLSLAIPGDGRELETLQEVSQGVGKRTGLVTTTYMTHATPAAFGAHESSRDNTSQVARDYLERSRPFALFGGGANGMSREAAVAAGYTVVVDRAELLALSTNEVAPVSGQFGHSHLPYEENGLGPLPHLHEMALKAIELLDTGPDGFFLMVEGGRIDHACHEHNIEHAIAETLEFDATIRTILDWASNRVDTLVIVTADHETGGLSIVADNGPGVVPSVSWSTAHHTAARVPLYAWGAGASRVTNIVDNTDIHAVIRALIAGPSD